MADSNQKGILKMFALLLYKSFPLDMVIEHQDFKGLDSRNLPGIFLRS